MVYYHGGGDMTAISEKCQKCLKNENGRCIAYKEFIGEGCLGYVDNPEGMIEMYKEMREYYLTKVGSWDDITSKFMKEIRRWENELRRWHLEETAEAKRS